MKITARQADGFAERPDPAVRAVLVFGPDAGLVRERAIKLCQSVVEDLADPFRVADLNPAIVAKDPALLNDEAAAIALTGGRRVIRVQDAGDRLAASFAAFLADAPGDALVVVEAGELSATSKLRKAFEAAKNGAALPCYRDEGRDLLRVVEEELAVWGLSADPSTQALLGDLLGGDRLLTRSEIAKLAVYAGDAKRIDIADVEAVIADSSFLTLDRIAQAVLAGDLGSLERSLDRAFSERQNPVVVLGAVRRELQRLALYLGLVADGQSPEMALKTMRLDPRRHFRLVEPLRAAAKIWAPPWAAAALERLVETDLQCKSTGYPAETLCREALTRIAVGLQRGRRAA